MAAMHDARLDPLIAERHFAWSLVDTRWRGVVRLVTDFERVLTTQPLVCVLPPLVLRVCLPYRSSQSAPQPALLSTQLARTATMQLAGVQAGFAPRGLICLRRAAAAAWCAG
jgi:hypothetical protein